MSDEDRAMILVEELVKQYNHGKAPVIDHANLRVDKGDMAIIMGRSGCGKTTLLNLIAGLDRATSGKIVVNGTSLCEMSEDELAKFRLRNIGFVFQDYNLISELTILENVMLPQKLMGKKETDEAERLLRIFDIDKISDELANTVSGGEAQRAAIARAMANSPSVLLADEPTGNLDEENERNVMEYLEKIQKEFGTTIVLATHRKEPLSYSNIVFRFEDSRIVASSSGR